MLHQKLTHLLLSGVVGLGLLGFANSAEAKIQTISVTGQAAAVDGDRAASEKAAKRAARRMAVEEGAGTLVESNTIIRNFQMVKDEIATSSKGVVFDEQWGPLKIKDGVASISLTAKVSPAAIEDAVCSVVKANHNPRIALVFVEKTGDEAQPWVAAQAERGRIEALFTESFMKNCFTIVEPGVRVSEIAATGDLPQETIEAIVKNANAQYVLLGQGKVLKVDTKNNDLLANNDLDPYIISASVRLLNTETNVIDAVSSHQARVIALNPEHAMKVRSTKQTVPGMVDEVMNDLFGKITEKWAQELVNKSSVSVTVKGVKNYRTAQKMRAEIERILSGSTVTQRTLKNGVAILDVKVDGGADVFAEKIDQAKFGKSTAEVLEVAPGKVIMQLN
jgi:uncharacterized protein